MSDFMIEIAEELQIVSGITLAEAIWVIERSKCVNVDNWDAWITDIRRVLDIVFNPDGGAGEK